MRNKYLCTRMFGEAFSKSVEKCLYICSSTAKSPSLGCRFDSVSVLDWQKMFAVLFSPAVVSSCQLECVNLMMQLSNSHTGTHSKSPSRFSLPLHKNCKPRRSESQVHVYFPLQTSIYPSPWLYILV